MKMKCKGCGYDCYGIVDIDKELCMSCWENQQREENLSGFDYTHR